MSTPRPAFYSREGDNFIPTGLGVSPWNGRSQLGPALAGLAGHILEQVPTKQPMITSRLTVDILGTVPMAPLAPVLRVIRDGQRMQMAEVEFYAAGRLWVRATAMRARIAETAERATPLTRRHPIDSDPLEQYPWFESRHVDCDRKRVGPGAIWARFKADVVANEPLAPLSVMAMIADFGSGTAPLMHLQEWTLANLDITVYLTRMPVSEWLLVDAESEGAGHGSGVSSARIGDARGMFARSLQSVFIDRR